MFAAGVSVGALATVGVAVGAALIGLNKVTNGAVKEAVGTAITEVKNIILDKEDGSCALPSDS